MSRTFRNSSRLSNKPFWIEDENIMRYLHKHYGDKPSGSRNAPRSYRKELDKAKDMKDKEELIKAMKDEEHEVVLHPRKKDANYDYW